MIDSLLWLDASPVRFFTVALLCMALAVGLALLPIFRPLHRALESVGGRALFVAVCCLALFAFRWPFIAFPSSFNPDEAQFIAQTIAFEHSPIPWKSFDGNNAGPLDTAILAIPAVVGIAPSYASARIVGLLLAAAAIACIYALVTRLYGELPGRLAALLPLAFFATAVSRDFIHYASETLSLALLAVAGLCLALMERETPARARVAAVICGLSLGAVPFAKIQGLPIDAVLVVVALLVAGRRRMRDANPRTSLVLPFVAALTCVPLGLLATVAVNGVFHDFVTSYILMPIEYDRSIAPLVPPYMVHRNLGFITFLAVGLGGGVAILAAAFLIERARRPDFGRNAGQWLPPLVALACCLAAWYGVERPGAEYIHYLLWFVVPIAALFGCAIGIFLNACLKLASSKRWLVPVAAVAIALAATVPFAVLRVSTGHPLYASLAQDLAPEGDPVLVLLESNVKPGDGLSVWGWMPEYYVATGGLLGTRDAITHFQIVPSIYRDYYRRRYLSDLARSRPKFFIDAVSPSTFAFHDPTVDGHEAFPELARIVAADYRQIGESYGVRLYERVH